MKVDIYITTKFSGRVTSGTGAYGILLQTEKEGKKYRKEHFAGWKNISYQKLNTRAVVEAIQCMVAPAHIAIHLDSAYAQHMIEKGNAEGNVHRELWESFYEAAATMKSVTVERTKHKYTTYMLMTINAGGYPVIEDR